MPDYKIYFKNNSGRLDEVLDAWTDDLNSIMFKVQDYEQEQPELLKTGKYIVVIE